MKVQQVKMLLSVGALKKLMMTLVIMVTMFTAERILVQAQYANSFIGGSASTYD